MPRPRSTFGSAVTLHEDTAPPCGGGRRGSLDGAGEWILVPLVSDDDGELTMADDPYAPYHPGDGVVARVGISLYRWGAKYERPISGSVFRQCGAEGDRTTRAV